MRPLVRGCACAFGLPARVLPLLVLLALPLPVLLFTAGSAAAQTAPNRYAALSPRALVGEWQGASRRERAQIAGAIAARGAAALPVLRDAVVSGSRSEKVLACSLIAEFRDADGVPAVLSATHDPDVEVRRRAATALRILADGRARKRMRDLLRSAEDLGVLKTALATLGKIGGRADRARIRPFLTHADAQVRVVAAIALAMLGETSGRDILLAAVDGDDPGAQKQATFGLGHLDDAASEARLQAILDDPHGRWKSYATIATTVRDTRGLDDTARVARLAPLAGGRSRVVNRWALEELTDIGTPEARAAIAVLADGNRPVAASARRRLAIAEGGK